jgi:hypothetical protein
MLQNLLTKWQIVSVFAILLCTPAAFGQGVSFNVVPKDLGELDVSAGVITTSLTATGDVTNWSALVPRVGAGFGVPANPATLSGTNNATFSWNPAGSKAGAKGSGAVVYQWIATATFLGGIQDTDVAVSLILIPEPSAVCLFALAGAFTLSVRRRPRSNRGLSHH